MIKSKLKRNRTLKSIVNKKITKVQCKPSLEFLQDRSLVLKPDREFLYPLVLQSKSLFLFPSDPLRV